MIKKIALVTVLLLVSQNYPDLGICCQCGERPTPSVALKASAIVFVGEVTGIKNLDGMYQGKQMEPPSRWCTFKVIQKIKGNIATEVQIQTGVGESDCGFDFKTSEKYLVYATNGKAALTTGTCDRTRKYDLASQKEIKELLRLVRKQ